MAAAAQLAPRQRTQPNAPRSIFVLRNNDLGDLLVVTPLFAALKRAFPQARIAAGVGSWNAEILEGNPHVDEIVPINAPWHNQRIRPQGLGPGLKYVAFSSEARLLTERKFEIGIDVLGSPFGSLLLMRAGIPWRLGVRGYAGGQSGVQQAIDFDPSVHVGRAALRFAEALGATDLPENRPQLFLGKNAGPEGHIVLAPGGGFREKCWPVESFAALARSLAPRKIVVIGGEGDRSLAATIIQDQPHVEDLTGRLSLRETFGAIARSALVVCNSSMAMHAAAAFRKPCVVLLGDHFDDAEAHARLWGYPETQVLGRGPARPAIWTPEETLPIILDSIPR